MQSLKIQLATGFNIQHLQSNYSTKKLTKPSDCPL